MHKFTKLLIFLFLLQLFGQFVTIECNPKTKKGKGKAFGAGILAGGLAGAAIGHVLTRNEGPKDVYHHMVDPNVSTLNAVNLPAPSKPTAIMENGEMLPNGCYKRIIKEPHQYDATRFMETEQLICPQYVPIATNQQTFVHQVPVVNIQQSQPIIPSIHMIQVPVYIQPVVPKDIDASTPSTSTPSNVSQIPNSVHKSFIPLPQSTPRISDHATDVVSTVPVNSHHVPLPAVVTSVAPQVIVLSKKSGFYDEERKKKNAGSSLFGNASSFLLSAFVLMGLY